MRIIAITLTLAAVAFSQPDSHDARGQAAFAAGRLRSAKTSFERAVRSAEGRPDEQVAALTNLGQTLIALDERAAAEEALRRGVNLSPESARTWHLLGQLLYKKGSIREAEAVIRKALALAPSDPAIAAPCLSDLATLLMGGNRKREAAEMLEQAIQQAVPGQARARMLDNLGTLQWRLGRREQAAETLGRALAEMEATVGPRHPDVARVLDDYSAVLAKTGRKVESRAMAIRASELKSVFGWQANAGGGTVDWRDIR